MANLLRNLRTTTAYSAQMCEQLSIFEAAKKKTDQLVSAILNSISDLNASNSSNCFERFGEMLSTYGAKGPDAQANEAFKAQRKYFDDIGRIHRVYTTKVEDQVINPLVSWTKNEYKAMHEEVKKLEKCRSAMDSATVKARKAAGNAKLEAARVDAEKAYEEQMKVVQGKLDLFFNDAHKSHAKILRTFAELQLHLYEDTSKKFSEAATAVPAT